MSDPDRQGAADAARAPMRMQLVRGTPSDDEIAALVVVLSARSGGGDGEAGPPRSLWASSGRVRVPHAPGSGAWRAAALPR